MTERTLLLVDDEDNILRALVRLLRRDGYTILKASSGEEGLGLLEQHPVGVILSDQRMPHMDGSEFLSTVKDRWPETIRLMLSGYTDLASVTEAINEGAVYKFLTKPWDDQLLRANVREAFEQHELRSENQRLTRALQNANAQLQDMLHETSRELGINRQVLELSREVIDQMPVGVLGIGSDGIIALANTEAHSLLGHADGILVGRTCREALPEVAARLYDEAPLEASGPRAIQVDSRTVDVYLTGPAEGSMVRGRIAVLIPNGG